MTYAEFSSRIRRAGHGLQQLGVGRGDRVGWLGANHPAFLEIMFATARIGAVMAPVNPRLEPPVIRDVLRGYSPELVVVDRPNLDAPLPESVRTRLVLDSPTPSDVDYEQLIADGSDDPLDAVVGQDDLCIIPHTSGTTGMPKGVMLTHGNITWNVINALSVLDIRSDDVTIAVAPFFRTGGLGVNVLPVLFKGGAVVIPEGPGPDEMLRLIEMQRVTVGFGNPDLLEAFTRSTLWGTADLSSIRSYIGGGAPIPERLIRTFLERGITFLQGYGLSEAAPLVSVLDSRNALLKVGSAGPPALFVDVRTVRPDGTDCGPDQTGELLVSGPNVMAGYWNDPVATREAIDEDGWLRTGDAARVDGEGFIWIVDRVGDAFETPGGVVYPGDIERALAQHPAVADAGVVGNGGQGEAFVVAMTGADVTERELLEFCREQLAAHEVPSSITFLNTLPRSSVGKLLRQELRSSGCD
jgi:fatty-acyl-CoA synthase